MHFTNVFTLSLAALASAAPSASRRQSDVTPITTNSTSKCSGRPFYLQVDGVAIGNEDQDPLLQNGDRKFITLYDRNNRVHSLAGTPKPDNTTVPVPVEGLDTTGAAALFRIDAQQRLVAVDSGKILNTYAEYRSNQVFWDDEDEIYGGWEAVPCWVDTKKEGKHWSRHLRCEIQRQIQWSTCFASDEDPTPGFNGDLYLTLDPAGQGPQCGGVKLKVVYV